MTKSILSLKHWNRCPSSSKDSVRWELQQLFDVLYRNGISQVERIVRLELLYHQVFDGNEVRKFQPKGLLVAISDSPSLFVDLLSYPWKDDNHESTLPNDQHTRVLANRVGGLLHQLTELPAEYDLAPMNGK